VGSLLNPETCAATISAVQAEYEKVRTDREAVDSARNLMTLAEARANAPKVTWQGYRPPVPVRPGLHVLPDVDLSLLREYIDWTPFLHTWRLPGQFPQVLDDPAAGPEARRLLDDANAMLDELIASRELKAAGVCGLFPAARVGDDLVLFIDETRTAELRRVPFLRQQRRSAGGRPNHCLADYVATLASGVPDHVGAFVVTSGLGAKAAVAAREKDDDDYRAIMVKAVADRLAEAFAEYLHRQVRRELWGYAPTEVLDNDALIGEKYVGIRPAPGYPACPDHLAKKFLFEILAAERHTGVTLTESCAMDPAASVSGWYFSHPEARYFGLGRIDHEQVADYAARAGVPVEEAARWLDPNLA
jgi:5-methyltetrahydrofolate--homocysteine methyltransferase